MLDLPKLYHAHDAMLKGALTDLSIAKDFLIQHLSPVLLAQLDLNTLQLAPGHLLSKELRLSETDILFAINFKDAKRPAYILMHLEHQSTVPYDMTLRVIQYKLKILEQARKFDPDADLPVVISIVVYNGKAPWTAPTDFYQLFGEQETLAREAFFNGYQLIDLSKIPDEELAKHRKASLIQWVLKHVHDRDFMLAQAQLVRFIRTYFATLSTTNTQDEDHLLSISYYLLSAANIDPDQQADFFATICDNLPKPIGDKSHEFSPAY